MNNTTFDKAIKIKADIAKEKESLDYNEKTLEAYKKKEKGIATLPPHVSVKLKEFIVEPLTVDEYRGVLEARVDNSKKKIEEFNKSFDELQDLDIAEKV